MRIHTRVVMDMISGDTLTDEYFEYEGPLALCGGGSGGGSSTTNTVDYGYNARMATLSEEQQEWAREYFGMWQDYQKPYEIAQTKANLQALPLETSIYLQQLQGQSELAPLQTELEKQKAQTQLDVIPLEKELYQKQMSAASQLLPQTTAAAKKFLTSALNGVDVNERMALATADASNAWKDVRQGTAMANARMGVNPNSGRFQGIMANQDTQKAAQLAGARTQARVGAENENYNRLKDAASFNAANGILQGIRFSTGS